MILTYLLLLEEGFNRELITFKLNLSTNLTLNINTKLCQIRPIGTAVYEMRYANKVTDG